MTGLDTNVLVRYLAEDDPVQSRKAAAWIGTAVSRGERCFISLTLDRPLATSQFVIGDKDAVRREVEAFRRGRADFADHLIGALDREAGCDRTVTFDRRLRGDTDFQLS